MLSYISTLSQWALFSVNHISYLGPTCLAGAAPLQSGDAKLVEFMGMTTLIMKRGLENPRKKWCFWMGKSWIIRGFSIAMVDYPRVFTIYIYTYLENQNPQKSYGVYNIFFNEDGVMGTNPLVICHSFRPVIPGFQFSSCYVVYWRLLVLWIQISYWFPCLKWSPQFANYCNEDMFGMAWNIASHM